MSECSPSFDGAQCGCCYEAEELRATVRRVREVCDDEFGQTGHQMMNPGRLGYRRALKNVLRALGGES